MSTRSVLIVGGSGFVGTHLAIRLRDECKVFTTCFRHPRRIAGVSSIPVSLSKPESIKAAVLAAQADVVVYAGGTREQSDAKEIELLHAAGPLAVLGASSILGSKFVLLSTNRVFDGSKSRYREMDAPMSREGIGKANLTAENGVKNRALHYVILRSSPAYGLGPADNPSFTDWIIRNLTTGKAVELDDHEVHNFAPIETLVESITLACMDEGVKGILHHSGGEACTTLELAKRIANRFKLSGSLLRPRSRTGPDATVPRDYTLDGTKLAKLLKMEPLLLEQGLDLFEKQLLAARS
jgi:dTDP-4-dehydrorhamnose reductase